ncbi:MAG: hypothetical protein WHS46_12440 [Desulfosoma sp.]
MAEQRKNERLERWERHRRRWYLLYFYVGVGVNLLLYFTKPYGFDPSGSLFWGSFYGIGIPLCTMFLGVSIHRKLLGV